jgi:hypothetical protein
MDRPCCAEAWWNPSKPHDAGCRKATPRAAEPIGVFTLDGLTDASIEERSRRLMAATDGRILRAQLDFSHVDYTFAGVRISAPVREV